MQASQLPEHLTVNETGELLRREISTLRRWRRLGIGPRYVRLEGGSILYPRAEVERYLAEHMRGTA